MVPFEVQTLLNDVTCPGCSDARFKVERAEGNPHETLFDASCQRCGLKMKIVAIQPAVIEELESMEPPEERHTSESRCPFCNGIGAAFNFRCHPESGVDYDVVTCRHCGRPYKEKIAP